MIIIDPEKIVFKPDNKHGVWELIKSRKRLVTTVRCSDCGFTHVFLDGHTAQYNYCPQCGLKKEWCLNEND